MKRQWKRIGVVAPSYLSSADQIWRGADIILGRSNFELVFGKTVFGKPRFNPFEGIEERAKEFIKFLREDSIEAIFCLEGGAGAGYLLPYLEREWLENGPWDTSKVLLGYSDFSYIMLALSKLGHVGFQCETITIEEQMEEENLIRAVTFFNEHFGRERSEPKEVIIQAKASVLREGTVEGIFMGGNLSILTQLMGTKFAAQLEGVIVFFENHGNWAPGNMEYLVWTFLHGVELMEGWKGVAGFCVGDIERAGPYATEEDLFPTIWDVLEKSLCPATSGPICVGFPFGYGYKISPLPIGIPVRMEVGGGLCTLKFEL